MLLVDAIERWAIHQRADIDDIDKRLLRRIWSTVRRSDIANLQIDGLTADECHQVLVLFPTDDWSSIAHKLDAIAEWAYEVEQGQADEPSPQTSTAPANGAHLREQGASLDNTRRERTDRAEQDKTPDVGADMTSSEASAEGPRAAQFTNTKDQLGQERPDSESRRKPRRFRRRSHRR